MLRIASILESTLTHPALFMAPQFGTAMPGINWRHNSIDLFQSFSPSTAFPAPLPLWAGLIKQHGVRYLPVMSSSRISSEVAAYRRFTAPKSLGIYPCSVTFYVENVDTQKYELPPPSHRRSSRGWQDTNSCLNHRLSLWALYQDVWHYCAQKHSRPSSPVSDSFQ